MSIKNEGSMAFWLRHEHKDWPTNSSAYNFGTIKFEDVAVEVVKYPDKKLEIKVTGPFDKVFMFSRPMPHCEGNACSVVLTWGNGNVHLDLNGKPEKTKSASEPA